MGHNLPGEDRSHFGRRTLLGAGVASAALLASWRLGPVSASALSRGWPTHPLDTTLDHTLLRGTADAKGYRRIESAPGEPHRFRNDLGGDRAARSGRRRPILAFGQFSDIHILDAQSPARVEFLDRYNDPGEPFADILEFQASQRSQDPLTVHVAEAMVQAMNSVRYAPVSGLPLAFTMLTGDNIDNAQYNELRWQIDVLDGRVVRPDSGDLTKYEGVGDWEAYDRHYWHPEGTPPGKSDDLPRSRYGFPTVPGLLDAARKPFQADGLRMPWLTAFGNHDLLVQGNVPPNFLLSAIATGAVKVIAPSLDISARDSLRALARQDHDATRRLFSGPFRLVTPDSDRRLLSRRQAINEHFNTTTSPVGHGYTTWNRQTGNAYYAFDRGRVRCVVLDTVNPYGGADGSLDPGQFAWLRHELERGAGSLTDRLFVVFSHHSIGTMGNSFAPPGVRRILGDEVRDLLLRFRNVVLWVNGHTHRNEILPHRRAAGGPASGGFWEINTASHIDWPQQARVIELVNNRNGTLSIFSTVVDHAAPASYGRRPATPLELAALARELGANDWQNPQAGAGADGRRGTVEDRNTELLVPAPFVLQG